MALSFGWSARRWRVVWGAWTVVLAVSSVVTATPFTVAVIPDTQNYLDYWLYRAGSRSYQHFFNITNWLASHAADQNIRFVTHVGDVVQNGGTVSWEWEQAMAAMSAVDSAGIPYSVSIGNHDYDQYMSRPSYRYPATSYLASFGPETFAGKNWYRGSDQTGLSSYQIFEGGGTRYLHLNLEFAPSPATLAWARGVLDSHANLPTIVTTHSYLSASGVVLGTQEDAPPDGASAQQIWEELKFHPQVFMILSGHWSGNSYLRSTNALGRDVHQVEVDYQSWSEGGMGYFRLMQFRPDDGRIDSRTYSPSLNSELTGAARRFSISMDFAQRLEMANLPVLHVVRLQQGVGGYEGTQDTALASRAGAPVGQEPEIALGGGNSAALLRFEDVTCGGRIPADAVVYKALLKLSSSGTGTGIALHRMLVPWSEGTEPADFGGDGVQADGEQAMALPDAALSASRPFADWQGAFWAYVDVTAAVQDWLSGEANYGWLLKGSPGASAWEFSSSEGAMPPELVVYWHHSPEPATALLMAAALMPLATRRVRQVG